MYTSQMKELIKKVEETRPMRLGVDFPRITTEEGQDLLKKFHPDFIEEGFRELQVGVNKGDRVPRELADLLEARSMIEHIELDLSEIVCDVDVLIIGGGGAGAAAALMAQEQGADVALVTKLRFGDANTMMAQGGIQAADKTNDSPAIHYLDVMGGGHFANIPELVYALVNDAPKIIKWLEDIGIMFDKEEDGTMITFHGGGTSRRRMHSARDYTGVEIMRTLRDETINKGIKILEYCPAVELLLDEEGKAAGAILYNLETEEYLVARAKTVILSTGGSGRLHFQGFPTTNHYGATADGLVMGYRAGARMAFMDAIQYHPTGVAYPSEILGMLVTEKFRGLGAKLVNINGKQFVYHLETRDLQSAAIIRECSERKLGIATPTGTVGIWLDSPLIDLIHGEGTIEKRFPAIIRQFKRFGLDIRREPILIYPTLHYQNGGLLLDDNGRTNIENLYVAGENSGGVHGRNRLMGNSLLDILVFGCRTGSHAAQKCQEVKLKKLTLNHVHNYHCQLENNGIDTGGRISPLLLPNYTHREVPEMQTFCGSSKDFGQNGMYLA
ncbi:MAG: FAD-dependent oxidoreductase [Bacillota bacterium]|nr:FAD-dependent oxidoreductase [Bacillota bacterium]